jgi:hypothetical protein
VFVQFERLRGAAGEEEMTALARFLGLAAGREELVAAHDAVFEERLVHHSSADERPLPPAERTLWEELLGIAERRREELLTAGPVA